MKTEAEKAAYAAKHYGVKESDVESKSCDFAKSLGGWHRKVKSSNNRGLPDRGFGHRDWPGRIFYIEFKKPKKTARKQQRLVIDDMRDNGEIVFVTDNLAEAKAIISDMFAWWEHS